MPFDPPNQEETRKLREAWGKGEVPECPRCGSGLRVLPVPPRPDVAYVRDRLVFSCSTCGFRAATDRR